MNRTLWVSLLALAAANAARAEGPPATSIVADTDLERSFGTTVTSAGPLYLIDGGQVAGTNLFHSFANFDLAQGDTAAWTFSSGDAASITNVINRVTGGSPSQLFGMLDSTALPNADFYFINPAGIVFGQGAQVNVPAAAYFSTASELRFGSDPALQIATPSGSTLLVSPPQSFGFIGTEGDINLSGAGQYYGEGTDLLPNRNPLHFSAQNISIEESGLVHDGLFMAATGQQEADVPLDGRSYWPLSGTIDIDGAQLRSGWLGPISGDGSFVGGGVVIRAGELEATGLTLSVDAARVSAGGALAIDINVAELVLDRSALSANASYGGSGGAVFIMAGTAALVNGSSVATSTYWGNAEDQAGEITLRIFGDLLIDGGGISSDVWGPGYAGNIAIEAETLNMIGGQISTDAPYGGSGGQISIDIRQTMTMSEYSNISTTNGSGPYGYAEGPAGEIGIHAGELIMAGGVRSGTISSSSSNASRAGAVIVDIDGTLLMDNGAAILAESGTSLGSSGQINVFAGALDMRGLASISTNAAGAAESGTIWVEVYGPLDLYRSQISTSASGTGAAGNVTIAVGGPATLEQVSAILSDGGAGGAGSISLFAGSLDMVVSDISSSAGDGGNAGEVLIDVAEAIYLDDWAVISTNAGDFVDPFVPGDAGLIYISAGSFTMNGSAQIQSVALGPGRGGDLVLNVAGAMNILDAYIMTDAGAEGDSGSITITADSGLIDFSWISSTNGDGEGGSISIEIAGDLTVEDYSNIFTDSWGNGAGGDVSIAASTLILDQSGVTSVAYWDGDGGDVLIEADKLIMRNGATIATDIDGAGLGGLVSVITGELEMTDESRISSDALEYATGAAGDVSIEADRIAMRSGSSIGSDARGDGTSGTVDVRADTLDMRGGAEISTNSVSANAAGIVTIEADEILLSGAGTQIASINLSDEDAAGDAGLIYIEAGFVRIADGARITTNSLNGAAGDIELSMPSDGLLILTGESDPGVIETSSGPGVGGRITIASPLAIISNGGSILALGDSGGANVLIDTPHFISSTDRFNQVAVDGELTFDTTPGDVSSGTVRSDLEVLDASGVLRGQCSAVRATGRASQLNIRPVGPFANMTAALPGNDGAIQDHSSVAVGGCQ